MPKNNTDYQKAKIYKICCKDVNITDCYIGSTANMTQRESQHKSICNNENNKGYNFDVYRFIRENGGWANWSVIVVQDFSCDTKHALETRERFHIEYLDATLTKYVPTRTQKEYRLDNTECYKERDKQWYKDNVEHIKAPRKAYRSEKIQCPRCNKILSRGSVTRHIRSKHTE